MMDSWETFYEENQTDRKLLWAYKIEKTQTQTYLGFVISNTGNNMANIDQVKKRSIGVIKTIYSTN